MAPGEERADGGDAAPSPHKRAKHLDAPSLPPLTSALRRLFPHMSTFRTGQEEVLNILLGPDQLCPGDTKEAEQLSADQVALSSSSSSSSALAIFPTGGGKSILYQLPALLLPHLTVVVCPLISLMKDQVDGLRRLGHPADCINSSLSKEEKAEVRRRVRNGTTKILFVAPEQLTNEYTSALILTRKISLIAIDEAHCISEWGHAFRPDFLRIPNFVRKSGAERVLALTATATPTVAKDIAHKFSIDYSTNCIRTQWHRPNLKMSVVPVTMDDKDRELLAILNLRRKGATIVYCTMQRTTEEIASLLRKHGFNAKSYHAGHKQELRDETQNWFMRERDVVVAATIAFGMGVDKRDIRTIVHYSMPKSLEGYAQEIGRAGRDGLDSECIMLGSRDDLPTLQSFAWGPTPTRKNIDSIFKFFFFKDGTRASEMYAAGTVREYSSYHISRRYDVNDTSLKLLSAFLDIYHGFITPMTPVYNNFQIASSSGNNLRDVMRAHLSQGDTNTAVIDTMMRNLNVKVKWGSLDLAACVSESLPRASFSTAMMKLEECPDISVKPTGLLSRFTIEKLPEDIDSLVDSEYERMLQRQEQELGRINQVVQLLEMDTCQSAYLKEYFGDSSLGFCCNFSCHNCRYGNTTLPEAVVRDLNEDAYISSLYEAVDDGTIPNDDPKLVCRVALGETSPRIIQLKIHKMEHLFGKFRGYKFTEIFGVCEEICARYRPSA